MNYRIVFSRFDARRSFWTKCIVGLLLLITAVADFATFLIGSDYRIFDMSLLTVITNNVLIIFFVKFLVIGGLLYLLWGVRRASDYWRFVWLMMAVYLIFFQLVGAISNRQVAIAAPSLESAPSVDERVSVGLSFSLLYGYYPIAFGMFCFWLWNWGWRHCS